MPGIQIETKSPLCFVPMRKGTESLSEAVFVLQRIIPWSQIAKS